MAFYSEEFTPRNDVVELLSTSRQNRRSRRNRKTCYRAPRFNNRVHSKHKGWLAPSVEVKIQEHITVIKHIRRILPIIRQILMGEMSKKWAIEEGIKSVGNRYSLISLESAINSLQNPPRGSEVRETDDSVINTLQAALSSFLYTHNYEECILHAVNLGGNTSEVAALAGGLAGARYRIQGIPKNWLNALAHKDRVDKLVIKYTNYFFGN